jgi:hypothetical protein
MIKNTFLFPQYYIQKVPYCDICNIPLTGTGTVIMTNPPMHEYVCESCHKKYSFSENEIQGEWRWRSI